MIDGKTMPSLKFRHYGKLNSKEPWVYTEGTKKHKLNGKACSTWQFDVAVPVDIDVIVDFKVGAKKGQRIPGSARASVANLRATGKIYVFMQGLSSAVISLHNPKVTWDFTVQVGTRNHATVVAGQVAAAAVTKVLGDNVVGDVVGVGAAVGAGAGAGAAKLVGKVFQGIAGKKKQAAKEAKKQSMDNIDVSRLSLRCPVLLRI